MTDAMKVFKNNESESAPPSRLDSFFIAIANNVAVKTVGKVLEFAFHTVLYGYGCYAMAIWLNWLLHLPKVSAVILELTGKGAYYLDPGTAFFVAAIVHLATAHVHTRVCNKISKKK